MIPSYDLVIVRRGLDDSGLPYWDMVAEILKAFPPQSGGRKASTTSGGAPGQS